MQEQFETQIDLPNNELCPQCEADDGDFYNGLAIGEICEECQAFNQAVDEALIEAGDELTNLRKASLGKSARTADTPMQVSPYPKQFRSRNPKHGGRYEQL
jgi:hypothetical protein